MIKEQYDEFIGRIKAIYPNMDYGYYQNEIVHYIRCGVKTPVVLIKFKKINEQYHYLGMQVAMPLIQIFYEFGLPLPKFEGFLDSEHKWIHNWKDGSAKTPN